MKKILIGLSGVLLIMTGSYMFITSSQKSVEQFPDFNTPFYRVESNFTVTTGDETSPDPIDSVVEKPVPDSNSLPVVVSPPKTVSTKGDEKPDIQQPSVPKPVAPKPDNNKPVTPPLATINEQFLEIIKRSTVTIVTDKQQGSGTLLNSQGFIITNAHVLEGHSYILVVDSEGTEYDANLVNASTESDIAVIFVKEFIGRSGMEFSTTLASVGDKVIAVGSPNGFKNTITYGEIVQTGISISNSYTYIDLYEMNAVLGLGSSGGPLISSKEQKIIALNTMIATSINRVGFSIPSSGFLSIAISWIKEYEEKDSLEELKNGLMANFYGELKNQLLVAAEKKDFSGLEELMPSTSQSYQQLSPDLQTATSLEIFEIQEGIPQKVADDNYQLILELNLVLEDEFGEEQKKHYRLISTFKFDGDDLLFPITHELKDKSE